MSKWTYKGKKLESAPEGMWGFVYRITHVPTGRFYIGSKGFYSKTNPKISKKRANELYKGKGRKKTRESKVKESNWKEYTSSSNIINSLIEQVDLHPFRFEILKIMETKQEMLLYEAYLISKEFLDRNENILNEWVSVKSFKLKA